MLQTTPLPLSRRDFVFSPLGNDGKYVVKAPRRRTYFRLGPRERLLLELLDGTRGRESLRETYRRQFGGELTDDDIDGFLQLAASRGLLESASEASPDQAPSAA